MTVHANDSLGVVYSGISSGPCGLKPSYNLARVGAVGLLAVAVGAVVTAREWKRYKASNGDLPKLPRSR